MEETTAGPHAMNINIGRVVGGGLIAGLIVNISAVAMVPVVGREMEMTLAKHNLPAMGTGAMIYFGTVSFALGIILVWLYAAVLPRMGPSTRTAAVVSFLVWFLAYFLANVSMVVYGFMPAKLTAIGTIWGLGELLLAGIVGARFYKEKGRP